jgi:hypothetical protein
MPLHNKVLEGNQISWLFVFDGAEHFTSPNSSIVQAKNAPEWLMTTWRR